MVQHDDRAGAAPDGWRGPFETALRRLALVTLEDASMDAVLELVVETASTAVGAATAASAAVVVALMTELSRQANG